MTSPLRNAARALCKAQSGVDCFDDLEPEAQEIAIETVRAVLAAQWQPIESAPKDGNDLLLWFPCERICAQGHWVDHTEFGGEARWEGPWSDGFMADARHFWGEPTHWLPFPTPPGDVEQP